jgi:hypothetical protein
MAQSMWKMVLQKRQYQLQRGAAIAIQSKYRAVAAQHKYQQMRSAALVFQCHYRYRLLIFALTAFQSIARGKN